MRVSFQEAISDPQLLKKAWDDLSLPQQVVLKAFYGLPLDARNKSKISGFSEVELWSAFQEHVDQDPLGYPTKFQSCVYAGKEYNQLWAILGRRFGKTSSLGGIIMAYEATLGGHEEYVRPNQECVIFLVAHKLPIAQANIKFVLDILDSSPILKDEVVNVLADKIMLRNGISIQPSPPSLKAQRGLACPVVIMDEVAFWYSDPDAANPDFEVERAISKSQLQFPNYKRIGISSPWTKEGLLWRYYKAGTDGNKLSPDQRAPFQDKLVVFGTTAVSENPALIAGGGRKRLELDQAEDPDNFERECLCRFPDAVSGFIAKALLELAIAKGRKVAERAPVDEKEKIIPHYVAALDPAFRRDSFGFCIAHKDHNQGIMVDCVRRWTPIKGAKLNPSTILAEIKPILDTYNIQIVYTDQYQLESLSELALQLGILLEGVDFTNKSKAKIFGNLQQLVNQGKLVLLDPDLTDAAMVMMQELGQLERRLTHTGAVQISAPDGKHDDMASCLALCAVKAVWAEPLVRTEPELPKELNLFERGMQTINKHKNEISQYNGY